MSEKLIERNIDLSIAFNKYAIKHPEATEKLPRGALLIFEDPSDAVLTKANRKLARESIREGEKCFRAIKTGRRWVVERIVA